MTGEGTSVFRTKWVAVATVVIALGAAGCGASDAGTGAAAAPASPRPKGSGPITREVVRTDLDTSAADADVPPNDPAYARMSEKKAAEGSPGSCGVGFKGFGTEATPVDVSRYEAVVSELRRRDWQQRGERTESKGDDGVILEARVLLEQRGWTLVTEYRTALDDGVITLMAFEDRCMKENAADAGPVG